MAGQKCYVPFFLSLRLGAAMLSLKCDVLLIVRVLVCCVPTLEFGYDVSAVVGSNSGSFR